MKYYIATSLQRIDAHRLMKNTLTAEGHEIAYDWTVHGDVKSTSKERLQEVALLELRAIEASDFVVVLLPGGGGTHLELGFALAKGKRVFLQSEDPSLFELGPKTNAFYHHPGAIQIAAPLLEAVSLIRSLLCESALG